MNIFVTDLCPIQSALNSADSHISKMPVEVGQMLSAVAFRHSLVPVPTISSYPLFSRWFLILLPENTILWSLVANLPVYGLSHAKHPCTLWSGDSADNWNWAVSYGLALCEEYSKRYGKIHASKESILRCQRYYSQWVPEGALTPFAVAISDTRLQQFSDNAVEKYRIYMAVKWLSKLQTKKDGSIRHLIDWVKCDRPEWFQDALIHAQKFV